VQTEKLKVRIMGFRGSAVAGPDDRKASRF